MFILIAVVIIELLIVSSIVGITAFTLFGTKQTGLNKKVILFSFITFVIFDFIWVPVISVLDLTITIGNEQMAKLLGTTDARKFLSHEWYDILIYAMQTLIAYLVGNRVVKRFAQK